MGISTKMYLGFASSVRWMEAVRRLIDERSRASGAGPSDAAQVFVAPSFPLLERALRIFEGSDAWVGAQNCSWGDGALTGEVSPSLLAEMGVRLVEIGHAERRELFGETDEVIRRKTTAVLAAGVTPLLCIGEPTRSDPEAAAQWCSDQVSSALADPGEVGRIMLAYEPVWAIGASQPAPPEYVNAVLAALRQRLSELSGCDAARFRVLYGGSAGPGLLPQLAEADGLFLGRFAHNPANVATVLDEAAALPRSDANRVPGGG